MSVIGSQPTRQRVTCRRCGRIIRRIPADGYRKWFNLQDGWRCRPVPGNPDQPHDPEESDEDA